MTSLFDPIRLGRIEAPNRVFMAPLSRSRATHAHVPTKLMIEYYRQRASAGVIFSEATGIMQQGLGWAYAPGIWNAEQVEAWKPVTKAVHEAGGRIVLQLWHMGRLVHPSFLGGDQPVSASATTAPGEAHTYSGKQLYAEARALPVDEIARIVDRFGIAAENGMRAGFDGVQIHAANGYLIDQFLRNHANFRTDRYGGSIENRIRILSEIAERVVDAVGADNVGVRLSPNGGINGVNDTDPAALFTAVGREMERIGVAYLELREPGPDADFLGADQPPIHPHIRKVFSRPLILNTSYDRRKATAALENGEADAISFGRPFISNPNLPSVLERDLPLAKSEIGTWYLQGAEGYTDYPAR